MDFVLTCDTRITTGYSLVAYTANYLATVGRLSTLVVDDLKIEPMKASITQSLKHVLHYQWIYDADRTWSRAHF